jgi:hypothetical protein
MSQGTVLRSFKSNGYGVPVAKGYAQPKPSSRWVFRYDDSDSVAMGTNALLYLFPQSPARKCALTPWPRRYAEGDTRVWPENTAVLGTPGIVGVGVIVWPFLPQTSPETVKTGQ